MDEKQRARIEREQVENVFGLTGGELMDVYWRVTDEAGNEHVFDYWHEGAPEYASEAEVESPAAARTVVADDISGSLPERITDDAGKVWELCHRFGSSGETECPGKTLHECAGHEDHPTAKDEHDHKVSLVTPDETKGGDECVLCEEKLGEPHANIYLGEGWVEVVYVCDDFWEED